MFYFLCLVGFQVDPALKASVIDAMARLNQFQVEFRQETYSDFLDDTVASGILRIQRPGKMRMDYVKGEEKVFICDGVIWYERDIMADTVSRLDQSEFKKEPLVQLLLYGADLEKSFLLDRIRDQAGDVYRLRPRDDPSYHIEVVFNEQWLPVNLEVVGADGEGSRFTFSNHQLHPQFNADLFVVPEE